MAACLLHLCLLCLPPSQSCKNDGAIGASKRAPSKFQAKLKFQRTDSRSLSPLTKIKGAPSRRWTRVCLLYLKVLPPKAPARRLPLGEKGSTDPWIVVYPIEHEGVCMHGRQRTLSTTAPRCLRPSTTEICESRRKTKHPMYIRVLHVRLGTLVYIVFATLPQTIRT